MLCVTFAGAVGRSRRFVPLPSLFWLDWTKNGRQPFLRNTSSLSLRNLYGVLLFQRSAQTFPLLGVTPSNEKLAPEPSHCGTGIVYDLRCYT